MKDISEKELLLLGYLEGELSPAEKLEVEAMLADDAAMRRDWELLKLTRLEPQPDIQYANKKQLLKPVARPVSLRYILWPAAVAASFALLLIYYNPKTETGSNELTAHKTTNDTQTAEKKTIGDKIIEVPKVEREIKIQVSEIIQPGKVIKQKQDKNPQPVETTAEPEVEAVQPLQALSMPALPLKEVHVHKRFIRPLPLIREPEFAEPKQVVKSANIIERIGRGINKIAGYLVRPSVEVNKVQKDSESYWQLKVEYRDYEMEGKLYTKR